MTAKKDPKWLCQVDANYEPVKWLAWTPHLVKRKDCFPVKRQGDRPDMTSIAVDAVDPEILAAKDLEIANLNQSLVDEQARADKAEADLLGAEKQLDEALGELQDARKLAAQLEDALGEVPASDLQSTRDATGKFTAKAKK